MIETKKYLLKDIFVNVIFTIVLMYFLAVNNALMLVGATSDRYYVGYCYYGHHQDVYYCHYGVSGNIVTISPGIPLSNFFAQWVCVIISYVHEYWIQVGYVKWPPWYRLTF